MFIREQMCNFFRMSDWNESFDEQETELNGNVYGHIRADMFYSFCGI